MTGYIITKWIEPYVLLETSKKLGQMKDYTFDGFNKINIKQSFLKDLTKSKAFGLYMKNVNKFYLFITDNDFNIFEFLHLQLNLSDEDFYLTEDIDEPFNKIDIGKAEASFISI